MKNIFFLLLLLCVKPAFSQSSNITVKAQRQTITTTIDDDNNSKSLVLNSHKKLLKTDRLVIYNAGGKQEGWSRSFIIYDDADAEIIKFTTQPKEKYYQIALKELFAKTKKNKDYSIYTIALPTDQKQAATVRVRRVLICRLKMK